MPALDGLRGLAVLLVLACHSAVVTGSIFQTTLNLVFGAGWVGVDLFFVLSGFLITGILYASRDSPVYYKSFFARRFLRIFPLYYVVVIITILLKRSAFHLPDVASLLFFYYNWQAVLLGHHLPAVNSLWSLAVEEQFYLVWPAIVLHSSKRALMWLCAAGMVLALPLRLIILVHSNRFQSAYYITPCRMDALLLGASLALCHTDQKIWKRLLRLATPVAMSASVGLLGIVAWTGHFFSSITFSDLETYRHSSIAVAGPGCTLLAILFGAVLVKCTGQGLVFRVFAWQPLRRVGKYSYGMYMLHWVILIGLKRAVLGWMALHLSAAGAMSISVLFFALLVAFTYGAAFVSYQGFERHFLEFKRRFSPVGELTVR